MVSLKPDMKRPSLRNLLVLAVLIPALPGCFAQSSNTAQPDGSYRLKVQEIHPKPALSPFALDAKTETRQSLEFRSPEQMTQADRNLAEANQAEIARRAGLQGLGSGFGMGSGASGEGGWGYEQAVCPVFPEHLILEYSRNNGHGDVTLFSAVIPRGDGHVRVIPVRRRGYSLFTPAPANAITVNDFNHMVQEGKEGLSPDWLTLGLCYAALAGGHVRAALIPSLPSEEVYPLFMPAKLTLGKGGAEVHFVDATPHATAMDWILTFSPNGRLLKVRHTVSRELIEKPVAGKAVDVTVVPDKQPAEAAKTGN